MNEKQEALEALQAAKQRASKEYIRLAIEGCDMHSPYYNSPAGGTNRRASEIDGAIANLRAGLITVEEAMRWVED